MVSDTARARQAVLKYLEAHGQGTTAELNAAILLELGEGYTEGKAAGAIRLCVEDRRYNVARLGRGLYGLKQQGVIVRDSEAFAAQKAQVDEVLEEALQLARAHISAHLDLYALEPEAFAYASRQLIALNQAFAGKGDEMGAE